MESICFVTQVATKDLLERVSNVCGECYDEFNVGDTIHYDTQAYRFLCNCCKEKLRARMNDECEIVYDYAEPTLFC